MFTASENDVILQVEDATKYLQNLIGPLPKEKQDECAEMLMDLINAYPPVLAPENQGPCAHSYENKIWCPRCQGKLTEDLRDPQHPAERGEGER